MLCSLLHQGNASILKQVQRSVIQECLNFLSLFATVFKMALWPGSQLRHKCYMVEPTNLNLDIKIIREILSLGSYVF